MIMRTLGRVFLISLFAILCYGLSAQSGFRTQSSSGLLDGVSTSQVSLNNAWFGSSFNYRLTGDANFNENFLFNANVLYNIDFDSSAWNFPIVGDLTLPLTGGSFEDIEIGLYPWRIVSHSSNGTVIVVHGGISYSVDPEDETGLSPQSLKVLAGAEVSVPLGNNNLPLTASATPVYQRLNLDRGNVFGLEGTFIFPVAANLGLIGEVYVPFDSDFNTTFSAGVLVNGAIGGN